MASKKNKNEDSSPRALYPMGLPSDNAHNTPIFGDPVTGRWNGRRKWMMDSLGNRYRSLPTGREKRGGKKTKGGK